MSRRPLKNEPRHGGPRWSLATLRPPTWRRPAWPRSSPRREPLSRGCSSRTATGCSSSRPMPRFRGIRPARTLSRRDRPVARGQDRRLPARGARRTTAAGLSARAESSTSVASVKAYYALKLIGDDPHGPHMARAAMPSWRTGCGALQRLHAHHARAVRSGALARRARNARRDHAAAPLVSVPPRQGVLLVAHGDRAAPDPDGVQAAPEPCARSGSRSCS